MTPTFDRTGYLKQIWDSETSKGEKTVLVYLATYCQPDRTISVSEHTAIKISQHVGMTNFSVGKTIQALKDAGLLTMVERQRRKFLQLPTEEKLAFYSPKPARK